MEPARRCPGRWMCARLECVTPPKRFPRTLRPSIKSLQRATPMFSFYKPEIRNCQKVPWLPISASTIHAFSDSTSSRAAPANARTEGAPTATWDAILPSASISTADGVPDAPNSRPAANP